MGTMVLALGHGGKGEGGGVAARVGAACLLRAKDYRV